MAIKGSPAAVSPHVSRRFAITTLGCKVNQYDATTIQERLSAAGHQWLSFKEHADVYIINSCTVTNQADRESRQLARRAKRLNPDANVIMTGCYAQVSPAAVSRLPEVDYVIGLNRLEDLVSVVSDPEQQVARILVDNLRPPKRSTQPKIDTFGALAFEKQTRAFLKIQEGCDLFCTFCIVPQSRGKSRSVEPRRIMDELHRLADQGFQEIVLTGIHLGGYGADLKSPTNLHRLLNTIEERQPAPRIRLSSLDPHEISPELLRLVAESETICPHLHIPLQWGNDFVLKRMRRRYDTSLARNVLEDVRQALPDAAVGTDLIVGFPGEGDQEFESGLNFLESSPFTYFHVFPYSVRSGTTAAKLSGRVPGEVIRQRAHTVRSLGEEKKQCFTQQFIGRTLPVLFENSRDTETGALKGYSRNYVRVFADGDDGLMNREVSVRILSSQGGRCTGTIEPLEKEQHATSL